MTKAELTAWRQVLGQVAEVITQLKRLANAGPEPAGDLLAQADALRADVIALTDRVQDRVVNGPRAARPTEPPLHGLPLSTDIDHGVPVTRFGVTGRAVAEKPHTPKPSGKWAQWRSKEHPTP